MDPEVQSGLHGVVLVVCLGVFDVGGGLKEVSLLFIQQTQLVKGERNQVVIISDPTLTGEHLCEAQLSLQ